MTSARKTRRLNGRVAFVGPSRSAGFWAAIVGEDKQIYFSYGANYVGGPPRIGQRVTYAALPRLPETKYRRATEVMIQPGQPKRRARSEIIVLHDTGVLQVVLVAGRRKTNIGELRL
jgi:hypothetical protein